jgi:hypothetical protein
MSPLVRSFAPVVAALVTCLFVGGCGGDQHSSAPVDEGSTSQVTGAAASSVPTTGTTTGGFVDSDYQALLNAYLDTLITAAERQPTFVTADVDAQAGAVTLIFDGQPGQRVRALAAESPGIHVEIRRR